MTDSQPMAIVGLGALFPGAPTTPAFWSDLVAGRDRLTEVPRTHWLAADYHDARRGTPDKVYTTRGGFLSEVEFSALEFGLPPNVLPATDTSQLLALVVAKRVLAEATSGRHEHVDRSRISVILGVASATELVAQMTGRLQIPVVLRAMRAAGVSAQDIARVEQTLGELYTPWQEATFPGLLGNVVAGRIANRLDLGGTNVVLDAACASSLAAVSAAVDELQLGRADLVVTGGVDTLNDIFMFMCFAQTGALSESGDCRPFAADADGTMLGEGIGLVALRRLADAERDGDRIYAVLRGVGSSSDGRANSIYAPRVEGQVSALRRAYARAGVSPADIELVEAHGTGTRAGDAVELEALRAVFTPAGARPRACALGSVKSQIGHTKAAAGAAGLIKVALALHHKVLPPTLKIDTPLPGLVDPSCPFFVSDQPRPWFSPSGRPRRASVSSFGFGGTNYHAVLEEYRGNTPAPERMRAVPTELVVLHADDRVAMIRRARELVDAGDSEAIAATAKRTQVEFDAGAVVRLAIVARDRADLVAQLGTAITRIEAGEPSFSISGGPQFATGPTVGPVALLFPGQGSQSVAMGRDLAIHFELARACWDAVGHAIDDAGVRLTDVVFPPPARDADEARAQTERLTATQWAQPALAIASSAAHTLLAQLGIIPLCIAGHSLGEITALAVAGAFDPLQLAAIARRRGELMAAASADTPGAMTAVAATREKVEPRLATWSRELCIANHNTPEQLVLSGPTPGIEAAERDLASDGIAFRRLPVSTAFHSPLVTGACAPLRAFLDEVTVAPLRVPVFANATAAAHVDGPDAIRDAIASSVAAPVRFVEQIDAMYQAGARVFLEVGPGDVLARLAARCLRGRDHVAVSLDRAGAHGVTALWDALARLSVAGVPLAFARLWDGVAITPASHPGTSQAAGTVRLTGANYRKPYPPASGELAARALSPAPTPVAATITVPVAAPVTTSTAILASDGDHAPIIAAQREFQRLMAESHQAFLRAMEASYTGVPVSTIVSEELPRAPIVAPIVAPVVAPVVVQQAPVPVAAAAIDPTPAPPAAVDDLVARALAVVAEKTGYPAEMIDVDMDLEADLGIDSIKRVEILAAMRERIPGLPEVDAARMGTLRTMRAILDMLGPTTAAAAAPVVIPAAPSRSLVDEVLAIVAEKTGYPAEMIELEMDLEADLGIDSIKRVEILSAMRERIPGLPAVDTARLASLRSLAEILAHHGRAPERVAEMPPAAAPGPASVPRASAIASAPARGIVGLEPARAIGAAAPGLLRADRVWIVGDERGIGQALVQQLSTRGLACTLVAEPPRDARCVVCLAGLRRIDGIDEAIAIQREAFELARRGATAFADGGLLVLVQDTGGDLGFSGRAGVRAWLAGFGALAKTAAREWPRATVRAIDVATADRDPAAIAIALCDELMHGGSEREIGLAGDGTRMRPVLTTAEVDAGGHGPGDGAHLVVTGGARGVTAACLVALARTAKVRVLVLGRTTPVPEPAPYRGITDDAALKAVALREAQRQGMPATPRDISRIVEQLTRSREWQTIRDALTRAGAEVRYASVDVRDAAALQLALAESRSAWGPIDGLVHGAGVLADALLSARPDATTFDHVFDTKVIGLQQLLAATARDPLRWICLFSSVAARSGNPGQADYAMANDVLNKVAHAEARRRGDDCRVVSIGWGPWDGGMVTASLRAHFAERNVPLLAQADGAAAFVAELAARSGTEIVVAAGMPAEATALAGEIRVDRRSYPALTSHRIHGHVVLPVVVVLEWFSQAVRALRPAAAVCMRDLSVVKGVRLTGYDGEGDVFRVMATPRIDGATIDLEIIDRHGATCYRARVDDGDDVRDHVHIGAPRIDAHDDDVRPLSGVLYGPRRLFHGPDLQMLREVETMAGQRARAELSPPESADRWVALDGALQLAVLYGLHGGRGTTLPMRIHRIVHHTDATRGAQRCELRERAHSAERSVFDIAVRDGAGAIRTELSGVEMYVVPSEVGSAR